MTFDRQLAIRCAKTIDCLYGGLMSPNIVSQASDTQVLIEKMAEDHFAIVFPGTASMRDWRTDLQFCREPWLEGRVHRGFRAAYESVERQIRDALPCHARVIIAGHSLGGALATLCAFSISGFVRVENVFTFGSPRVGNGRFVRAYNESLGDVTVRLINAHDPVPYVPPWLLGNRHVDTEAWLDDDGDIIFDRGVVEIARARTAGLLEKWEDDPRKQIISISAHKIDSYIAKLEALA